MFHKHFLFIFSSPEHNMLIVSYCDGLVTPCHSLCHLLACLFQKVKLL